VLSCASWCQLQRAPLGKLLKLQARFPKYRTHNAGVEGSSPSLSTIDTHPTSKGWRIREGQLLSPECCGLLRARSWPFRSCGCRSAVTSVIKGLPRRNSTPSWNSLSPELSTHPLWVFRTCPVDEVRAKGLSSGRATHEFSLCLQWSPATHPLPCCRQRFRYPPDSRRRDVCSCCLLPCRVV